MLSWSRFVILLEVPSKSFACLKLLSQAVYIGCDVNRDALEVTGLSWWLLLFLLPERMKCGKRARRGCRLSWLEAKASVQIVSVYQ